MLLYKVTETSYHTWIVEDDTSDEECYYVRARVVKGTLDIKCSCLRNALLGKICNHIIAVKEYENRKTLNKP
jgi:hypothetical protein